MFLLHRNDNTLNIFAKTLNASKIDGYIEITGARVAANPATILAANDPLSGLLNTSEEDGAELEEHLREFLKLKSETASFFILSRTKGADHVMLPLSSIKQIDMPDSGRVVDLSATEFLCDILPEDQRPSEDELAEATEGFQDTVQILVVD
jgi:hypothetical protein